MDHPNLSPAKLQRAKQSLYEESPVHPISDLLAWECTVVFSPHPDDESLGCGGLIRHLRDLEKEVYVVFMTDGAMSHPKSTKYSREDRTAIRREEALRACDLLGVPADHVRFFGLRDGEVPSEWHPSFAGVIFDLIQLVKPWGADTFVVPWRRDPHEDHRASWEICRSAVGHLNQNMRWIEYPVWMWEAKNLVDLPRPEEVIAWHLPIEEKAGVKEAAIRAHRSQWDGVIDDDPGGFQLPESMIEKFLRPREVYFVPPDKRFRSLSPDYFEAVYRDREDPWNFDTSSYEQDKYAATMAALPEGRYESGLEIGCSIGVLSARLAERCDRLLCVDVATQALDTARDRLRQSPTVEFKQMCIPEDYPDREFDLVILSEVGYYWSKGDLEKSIRLIQQSIRPGGILLLVHFTPYVPDYPLTGDEVHETFSQQLTGFDAVAGSRADRYRLDVWRKAKGHERNG